MPTLKECLEDFDKVVPGSLAYISKNKIAIETKKRAEFLGMLPKSTVEETAKQLQAKGIFTDLKDIDGEYYEREIQLGKINANEILMTKFLPATFYGFPLMASILDKSFVLRNSEDFLEYMGPQCEVSVVQRQETEEVLANLNNLVDKTNSNSASINPNKEEIHDDHQDQDQKDLVNQMDDFLIKLPTIKTGPDGYVYCNTSGDFGFPLQLKMAFDENGLEVCSPDDSAGVAINNGSNDSMEIENP